MYRHHTLHLHLYSLLVLKCPHLKLPLPLPPRLSACLQYMPQIWQLLFSRLQSSRTTKYVRCFLLFVALFTVKHGGAAVSGSIDTVQPGLTAMILQQVG